MSVPVRLFSKVRREAAAGGVTGLAKWLWGRGAHYADPWRVASALEYRVSPFARRSDGDLPYDPSAVRRQLNVLGVPVESLIIEPQSFRTWLHEHPFPADYQEAFGRVFVEKALEHYVGATLLGLGPDDTLIDVAAAGSSWAQMAEVAFGCPAYTLDLAYPAGIEGRRIGSDAAAMPVADGFASKLALHCSFEMFEGVRDTGFVREAARVLRPGGRAVVVPLYLSEHYHVFRGPMANTRGMERGDPGAQVVYRSDFGSLRFARFYDAESLLSRVIEPASQCGLVPRVLRVENAADVDPSCYLAWVLVLDRPVSAR